jgi:hypothetical protein
MTNKDKLLVKLYKEMAENSGNYDKICEVISQYIGHIMGPRNDWDAHEEALELYEDLKNHAYNAGYINRTTKAFD